MKKLIWVLIGFALLFLIFRYGLPYLGSGQGCYLHRIVYIQVVDSKVVDKFMDSTNHSEATIIFAGKNNIRTEMIFSPGLMELFYYLNIGDSVIKNSNSITYKVRSISTKKDTIFKYKTNCADSINKPNISHYK